VRYLTDFADQAVILPLVLAVGVGLAMQGWWRGAATWLAVVGGTFLAMLGLKLVFLSCSPLFGPLDIHSPSGHVAAATVVAGGLAVILNRRRTSILSVSLIAATVIGVSRLVLGVHSLPEVVMGAMIGLVGAITLMRFAGRPPALNIRPLIGIIAVVALVFHGLHLPAEAAIRQAAYHIAGFIPECRASNQSAHYIQRRPDQG
jgi:membrane-associated phospholipid phosphatase